MSLLNAQISPIFYDSSYEFPEENETETRDDLVKTLRGISETTFKHSHHATRNVHAKSHGLLVGELKILDDLPAFLKQGLFAKPATLPVVMRFSTIPGDVLDDNVSTPRGLAIKVIGVEGERLLGAEDAVTQDFVLANGPVFLTKGAKQFLSKLKILAPTTDKVPGLKRALSTVLQGTEKLIEAVGGKSATIISMGGHPENHILGETYFSQVPILYGQYMAKISVVPVSPSLQKLVQAPVDLTDKPNGLREAVVDFFAENTAEWELRVQLCTDVEKMPIEDASIEWSQELSPFIVVARITAKPQIAWSDARAKTVDDAMSFSPWHGIAAHRPLGAIMRVRKMAYEMSARFRAEHNQIKVIEPKSLQDLPTLNSEF